MFILWKLIYFHDTGSHCSVLGCTIVIDVCMYNTAKAPRLLSPVFFRNASDVAKFRQNVYCYRKYSLLANTKEDSRALDETWNAL
jgi:hypothetical protein